MVCDSETLAGFKSISKFVSKEKKDETGLFGGRLRIGFQGREKDRQRVSEVVEDFPGLVVPSRALGKDQVIDLFIALEQGMQPVTPAAPVGSKLQQHPFVLLLGHGQRVGDLVRGIHFLVVEDRAGCFAGRISAHDRQAKER